MYDKQARTAAEREHEALDQENDTGAAEEKRAPGAISLDIEHVSQSFGSTLALDDVSLSVAAGETLCLLGQSGCGKTTMLRAVAGIERPELGTIKLGERVVTSPSRFVPPEARGVGLVFQDYALFPHLTIARNITFGLTKQTPGKAREIAQQALERVRLGRYADDYPHMLSGGEQQRVALARALAPNPGILLMDEPFSNLDQRTRESIRQETMELLHQSGTTSLIVTHDPVEAMVIADRIALMRDGKIVQSGSASEIYNHPTSLFAARYFCDLNEIEGAASGNIVSTPLGRFEAANTIADGPCLVCIRPQAITFAAEGTVPITCSIGSRRFLGEVDYVAILIDGIEKPLHARLPAGYAPSPGEKAGLKIDPSGVLAFPIP